MIFNFITMAICLALSIVAFYFVLANLALMKKDSKEIVTDGELKGALSSSGTSDQAGIVQDIENYGRQLINKSGKKASEIKDQIAQQLRFKQKQHKQPDPKEGLLNNLLKYVTPVSNTMPSAPDLENYEDYAPVNTGLNNKEPILSTNKVVPNYLELEKDAYLSKSTPLAINEFDTHRPANFLSERTAPYFDKISGENLSYFFQKNPFKSFDEISKADVVDPAEWDRIAKKKEESSPLLSLSCMRPTDEGFMPSNHYETGKKYASLC
jgi:hypothetical protein